MYEDLGQVQLKSKERVQVGVVSGPDLEWAERIEALLGHKGPVWQWQNSTAARQKIKAEVRYYLLHRDGVPFANMMTAEAGGVGHFGHVWTQPEDRRQGAASRLMAVQMDHFKQRGGRALYLGTGYDSAAYHIYRANGFVGIEPQSGYMEYYRTDKQSFETEYFSNGTPHLERVDWHHWPASAALFLGDYPGSVRCAPLGLWGRTSTEGPLLEVLQREGQRHEAGKAPQVQVLWANRAVVGLAAWEWDRLWPDCGLVDVYCHPKYWQYGPQLLEALALPPARAWAAYCDEGGPAKKEVLRQAGFSPVGPCPQPVGVDHAQTQWAQVEAWVLDG